MATTLTPQEAWHLARYHAGGPVFDPTVLQSDLARLLNREMQQAGPGERDAAMCAALETLPAAIANQVKCALVAVDVDGPMPEPERSCPPSNLPPLPPEVLRGMSPTAWLERCEEEVGEDAASWIDLYLEYAGARSPLTPSFFHESAALWLGATAIAGRLQVRLAHAPIAPNLYLIWIAGTSVWGKTTALTLARNMALNIFPHLLAAHDTTNEALLADLSGIEPSNLEQMPDPDRERWLAERDFAAQRGMLLDEMSGLLAAAGRDYNKGLLETLLRLYDCPPELIRSLRTGGRMTARQTYFSVLGAATPESLSEHLAASRLWEVGWWPRFALLSPQTRRATWRESEALPEPAYLGEELGRLYTRLPRPTYPHPVEPIAVRLAPDVFEDWRRYDKALRYDLQFDDLDSCLRGTYSRMPAQVIKIATILAAYAWPEGAAAPRIDRHHLARAIAIAEEWRASAHRVLEAAQQTDDQRLQARILSVLPRFLPHGATARELQRAIARTRSDQIQGALTELLALGYVLPLRSESHRRGERYIPAPEVPK